MPTVLRQFPEQSRGPLPQQTAYVQIPGGIDALHLVGQASDAVLSNPANSITFTILASATGQDSDARILVIEPWRGGTHQDHSGATVPNPIDVGLGLDARRAGDKIALRAVFGQAMVVGATLTGLP